MCGAEFWKLRRQGEEKRKFYVKKKGNYCYRLHHPHLCGRHLILTDRQYAYFRTYILTYLLHAADSFLRS